MSVQLHFDILQAVGHALATDAPLQNLLELVADMVLEAVPSEAATIFLKCRAGDELEFAVTRGQAAEQLKNRRIPVDQGVVGWVVQNARHAIVPDAESDERFNQRIDEFTGFRTRCILCVPLRTRRGVIGALELINRRGGMFSREEADYVSTIANQTAQLIDNVRLMQEQQRSAESLQALCNAAQWLNSSLDRDAVLERIVGEAEKVIHSEAGSILLVDSNGGLRFAVALGPARERLLAMKSEIQERLNQGQGIAAWVAEHGKPVVIPDCSRDPRFTGGPGKLFARQLGFEARSMLCVPMRARGKVVGVLQLINKQSGEPFGDADLSMLSVFADDAAAALTNAQLYESLQQSYMGTITSLVTALDTRDNETGGHSQRVALFAQEVAKTLGMDSHQLEAVFKGSLLHDIGKIGVPDAVLRKPGKLDDDEWKIMRMHVALGCELLEGIEFLREASLIPLFHHEQYDGSGYLLGLRGDEIPLGARIFAVVDTYDAITADRPYRKARSNEEAIEEIRRVAGSQLDPEVVDAFLSIPADVITAIREMQGDLSGLTIHQGDEDTGEALLREMYDKLKASGLIS